MGMHCGKHLWRHHQQHKPIGALLVVGSVVAMGVGTIVSLAMMERLTRALEVMAAAKALHEMEGRLSDIERAELEGRIRAHLFPG